MSRRVRRHMVTLIVTWPEDRRQTFSLQGERVTVGRGPENGIRIESPFLSAAHAEFRRLPGGNGYGLADLESANGTFVNGIPARGEVPLRDGDRIRFGLVAAEVSGLPVPEVTPVVAGPQVTPVSAAAGDLEVRLDEANREIERLRCQLEAKRHAKEVARQVEASRREVDSLREEQGRLASKVETARAELQAIRDDAAKWRAQVAADREELGRLRPEVEDARQERDQAVAALNRERDGADEARDRIVAALERTRQELAMAKDLLRKVELQSRELESGLARQRNEERLLTDRLQMLHRQQFSAEKRIRELEGESSGREG